MVIFNSYVKLPEGIIGLSTDYYPKPMIISGLKYHWFIIGYTKLAIENGHLYWIFHEKW